MKKYAAVAIAGLLFALPASAQIRTFDFVARVDQTAAFVPAGTMVAGSFSYDAGLAPTDYYVNGDLAVATYVHPSITISASFAGSSFASDGRATVSNLPTNPSNSEDGDGFSVGNLAGPIYYEIAIWQPDRNWLTGTGLPALFPSALWQGPFADPNDDDDVTIPHGEFFFWNVAQSQGFSALVVSVTPASIGAVPEPSTWAMMIAGFGLAGGAMRRRKTGPVGTFAA